MSCQPCLDKVSSDAIFIVYIKQRLRQLADPSRLCRTNFEKRVADVMGQFTPRYGEQTYSRCEPIADYVMKVENSWICNYNVKCAVDRFVRQMTYVLSYRERRYGFTRYLSAWLRDARAAEAHMIMVFMHIHALIQFYYERKEAGLINEVIYMTYDLLGEAEFPDRWEQLERSLRHMTLTLPEHQKAETGCCTEKVILAGAAMAALGAIVMVPVLLTSKDC